MDIYDKVAYESSRQLTLSYSTSFGISSRFFGRDIKPHIYAIYGLARIADEIVDTYKGDDAGKLLDDLEKSTYAAMRSGYSTNPVIHAFALTARRYGIHKELIAPFYSSMRMDLFPRSYTTELYEKYIHGSAEVIGLMCLRVFVSGDDARYAKMEKGAASLGAAYQKINFLRDLAADYQELGRLYFPGMAYETFDDREKETIINDIKKDMHRAFASLVQLPQSSRKATMVSYVYYSELLRRLEKAPAQTIKTTRLRVSSQRKLALLFRTLLRERRVA